MPQAIQENKQGGKTPTAVVIDWLARGIHPGWQPAADYTEVNIERHRPIRWVTFAICGCSIRIDPLSERAASPRDGSMAFHKDHGLFNPIVGLPLARVQTSIEWRVVVRGREKHGPASIAFAQDKV